MVSFTSIYIAATAFVAATLAAPTTTPANATDLESVEKRSLTTSSTGYNGGYYYSFWTDGAGSVAYDNWDTGTYHVQWSGNGNWVGGKGWSTGSAR
jgi:endo-1,4-beta-xylanase